MMLHYATKVCATDVMDGLLCTCFIPTISPVGYTARMLLVPFTSQITTYFQFRVSNLLYSFLFLKKFHPSCRFIPVFFSPLTITGNHLSWMVSCSWAALVDRGRWGAIPSLQPPDGLPSTHQSTSNLPPSQKIHSALYWFFFKLLLAYPFSYLGVFSYLLSAIIALLYGRSLSFNAHL